MALFCRTHRQWVSQTYCLNNTVMFNNTAAVSAAGNTDRLSSSSGTEQQGSQQPLHPANSPTCNTCLSAAALQLDYYTKA